MMRRESLLALFLVGSFAPAAFSQQDHVAPTVTISGSGFTVESHGTVTYSGVPLVCNQITGKHNIVNGNGSTTAEKTFGPMDGNSDVRSYDGNISGATAYSNCYRANLEVTGQCGDYQRVTSAMYCAPSQPQPPQPPPTPDPPPGGCIDNCGGTFDASGAGSDPLVISVRGPYDFSGLNEPVFFDINAIGHTQTIGWTARNAEIAFLALDRNGNGRVDDGSELFGNATPLPNGDRAANGFDALSQYDLNGDGVIDRNDPIWRNLILWVDRNHNGVSEPGEIRRVTDSSITAIELRHRWTGRRDQFGNHFGFEGRLREGNEVRTFYDVFFVTAK